MVEAGKTQRKRQLYLCDLVCACSAHRIIYRLARLIVPRASVYERLLLCSVCPTDASTYATARRCSAVFFCRICASYNNFNILFAYTALGPLLKQQYDRYCSY